MGQLYQRGKIWWTKHYVNGRPVRESTRTTKQTEAERILKTREGRAAAGMPMLPPIVSGTRRRPRISARTTGRGGFATWLRPGPGSSISISSSGAGGWRRSRGRGAQYWVARRQAEGAANGTINREVGVLLKLMHLAHEHNKLHRVPRIRTLKEAAPRQGFFETDQFLAVRARLPADLQVAVSLAFELGWRMPSEVLTLERRQVDVAAGAIRLEPGSTKNDEGRMVYVTPGLRMLLVAQVARVEALQRRLDRIVPYLFPHLRKGMLAGKRRRNFTKAVAAGVPRGGRAWDVAA